MIIHNKDGLKYDVQWSIKTIETTQHVITSEQLNIIGAELGPAQPQFVSVKSLNFKLRENFMWPFLENLLTGLLDILILFAQETCLCLSALFNMRKYIVL